MLVRNLPLMILVGPSVSLGGGSMATLLSGASIVARLEGVTSRPVLAVSLVNKKQPVRK